MIVVVVVVVVQTNLIKRLASVVVVVVGVFGVLNQVACVTLGRLVFASSSDDIDGISGVFGAILQSVAGERQAWRSANLSLNVREAPHLDTQNRHVLPHL